MRLGLWNRLYVVFAALTLAILPLIGLAIVSEQHFDTIADQEKFCLRMNDQIHDKDKDINLWVKGSELCYHDARTAIGSPFDRWEVWREGLAFAIGAIVVFYALARAIAATVRWVWAGRKQPGA